MPVSWPGQGGWCSWAAIIVERQADRLRRGECPIPRRVSSRLEAEQFLESEANPSITQRGTALSGSDRAPSNQNQNRNQKVAVMSYSGQPSRSSIARRVAIVGTVGLALVLLCVSLY